MVEMGKKVKGLAPHLWALGPRWCNSYYIVAIQNRTDYVNLPKTRTETENSLHLALDLLVTVRHSMCRFRHGGELQQGKIRAQEDRRYEQDTTRQWQMRIAPKFGT